MTDWAYKQMELKHKKFIPKNIIRFEPFFLINLMQIFQANLKNIQYNNHLHFNDNEKIIYQFFFSIIY